MVLNCRDDTKRAEALAAELGKAGTRGAGLQGRRDRARRGARCWWSEALKAFGRVDVLVNTVGAFEWKAVAETEPAEWRAVMASNLDSAFLMARLVAALACASTASAAS